MSGGDEMMAAMGFTAFGRARRERVPSKKAAALSQLMPGTELAGRCADLPADSAEEGPCGVVYLLCKEKGVEQRRSLHAALDEDAGEGEEDCLVPYAAVLEELEQEKRNFDRLESSQFGSARAATNAFERLGRRGFLNRSAMKLVTLDHVFQWTRGLAKRQEPLSFADICGGPGGFSEYLLWRADQVEHTSEGGHSQGVQGYGITLKGAANNCDWRLPSKLRDSFEICYGEDGTGNLYSIANIRHFRDAVRGRHPRGVDLVVADGGFIDARSQSNQEAMMTRLILAEVLTMFGILRAGGDFVCKTFELATPAMLQLCWVLHESFERFAVIKPITSRPASSERYIVARGLRVGHASAKLVAILEDRLAESTRTDVGTGFELRLLPNSRLMRADRAFLQYMSMANEAIARVQVQACRSINEFAASKKRKTRGADGSIDPNQYFHCWQLGKSSRHKQKN